MCNPSGILSLDIYQFINSDQHDTIKSGAWVFFCGHYLFDYVLGKKN